MSGTSLGNKERKRELEKRYKLCGHCPYHRKENATKHPRTDKYKNKR